MDDDQLKALLDRIAEHTQPKVTTVKVDNVWLAEYRKSYLHLRENIHIL
jgi:hypothetical protein